MESQTPVSGERGLDIRKMPTKVRLVAKTMDIDQSGFIDEQELAKTIEELVDRRRANYLLKWIIASLALLLCLSTAATVGAIYALIVAQKDTQSARGALSDTTSGETLRTARAAEQLQYSLTLTSPEDATVLLKKVLPEIQTQQEFFEALDAIGAKVASGTPLQYHQAYLLPQNITDEVAAATGVRALGVIELDISDRMCSFFSEGHQTVQLNVESQDDDTVTRVDAELINVAGCKQEGSDERIFSMYSDPDSLILACEVGKECILVSLSPLNVIIVLNGTSSGTGRRRLLQRNGGNTLTPTEKCRVIADSLDSFACGPVPQTNSLTFYTKKQQYATVGSGGKSVSNRTVKKCIFTQCKFNSKQCLADPSDPWKNCKAVVAPCQANWMENIEGCGYL